MLAGFRVNICNFWMYFTFTVLLSFKQPPFPHHIHSLARRVAIGLNNETPESAVHRIDIKRNYILFCLVFESCTDTPCCQIWEWDLRLFCSTVCYLLMLFLSSGLYLIHKWFQREPHGEFHSMSSSFCHI